MNWGEIISLLNQGEGQALEFDKSIPSQEDIAREYVAFSNSDGGKIIYGIDDKNKHLTGVEEEEGLVERLTNIGRDICHPPIVPIIEMIDQGGKKLIIIEIKEGEEKPYFTDDICYIRDSDRSRAAREKEIEEIKSPWASQDLNKRQKKALQYVSEHGQIKNSEYREAYNVSHKTAHIELSLMVEKKLLESQGAGRNTHYTLPPM